MIPSAPLARHLTELPRPERRAALAAAVVAELAAALLVSPDEHLPLEENLFELGLTSLKTAEVKQELEAKLGLEIEVSVLFSQPTVQQLLTYLVEALPDLFAPAPVDSGGEVGEPGGAGPDEPDRSARRPYRIPATAVEQHRLLEQLLMERCEPIAVVGIGLRFPGGNDTPAGFADFLAAGRSGTGPIPADRWDVAAFASTVRTAGGGFLDGIDHFDARFFNISPKEAQYVDPQQRILLETVWAALEHANIDPTGLRHGTGGVYVGVSNTDYSIELDTLPPDELDGHLGTGNAHSAMAGRLSYFLGWRGPCLSVDTACSSSLVALHLAVTALRRRECGIALVGGVNTISHPRAHIICSAANMLAADGRCKTFDDSADGYARSEGCGVIVLERLSDAERAGHRILGLVRGTAVRQDGVTGGLTVPNGTAQEEVMRAALADAALTGADVQYVEAHGTGTALGDPIEMAAIRAVLADGERTGPLVVGSVKTNIGHMEPAAGIGGMIKSLLQMQRAQIFPHLNLATPSRHIPWDSQPIVVPTEGRPWPAGTRRALVNAFGFAGTIATVVLEQPPAGPAPAGPAPAGPARAPGPHVFTLSAKSRAALRGQVLAYQRHLADHPDEDVADICYTGNVGRAHFGARLAGVVGDRAELDRLLDDGLSRLDAGAGPAGDGSTGDRGAPSAVALLFSGQGAQYPGMGRSLYERFSAFREHVDECDRLFTDHLGLSIRDMMLNGSVGAGELGQTRYTQPALFTLEYALARLWQHWGLRPDVLIGHSIGEVTAAAVAGLFALPDAVRLVSARADLMQSVAAPGGMLAVPVAAEEIAPLLAGIPDLALAALNAPQACVVSGGQESLARLQETLTANGVRSKPLAVSHAFHSPLMDEVSDAFRAAIGSVEFREPELTMVSNLTGAVADPRELSIPDYWVRHISEPVNFLTGMRTIAARGRHMFVEVGPGTTLIGLGRRCVPSKDHRWLASLRPGAPDTGLVQTALAELYAAGIPVSWVDYHEGRTRPTVTLPTYAFDRRRYWLPAPGQGRRAAASARRDPGGHPLLGTETTTAQQRAAGTREFATALAPDAPDYLADHVVLGQVVFPAAGYVETLLALLDAVYGDSGRPVRELRIHEPMLLPDGEQTELRVRLQELSAGEATVEIVSRPPGGQVPAGEPVIERRHVTAVLAGDRTTSDALAAAARVLRERAAVPGLPTEVPLTELYADSADRGLAYGPRLRRLTRLTRHGAAPPDLVVGEQSGPPPGSPLDLLPPAILDCAFQTAAAALDTGDTGDTYLPVGIEELQLVRKPRGERLRSLLRVAGRADREVTLDLTLLDGDQPVLLLRGLTLRRLASPVAPAPAHRRLFHHLRWLPQPLAAGPGPDPGPPPARHVLVVGRAAGALAGLAGSLRERGGRLSVAAGPAEAAAVLPQRPTDVCWCWQPEPRLAGLARLRAETEANYCELLDLIGVLDRAGFGYDQRLWLVTEGIQVLPGDPAGADGAGADRADGVDGVDGPAGLAAASLWGFGLTVSTEYPGYQVRMVDVPRAGHAALLDEWLAADTGEDQVAYRGGIRYVRRIQPADPDGAAGTVPVRPDERYLITGGLGDLGLATARHLADLGARHLDLVSRRAVPAAEVAALAGQFGPDVEVTVHRADVGEPADVERLAAALRQAPQPLGGVVHAAATLADGPVAGLAWAQLETVFRAKVYGTWLLHEALAGVGSLRFFVGYSSVAAMLGPPGQANYAAGNAFLDAVLCWRAARGQPGLSLNWGPWAEIGMAARLGPQRIGWMEAQGIRFLPPATAVRALGSALGGPASQVMVGEFDWDQVVAGRPAPSALYRSVTSDRARRHTGIDAVALRACPPPERKARVSELVRVTVADLLHFDGAGDIAGDAAFVELGLDSLVAMELKNALESALGVLLPASITYDHPTVAALTDFIDGRLTPTGAGVVTDPLPGVGAGDPAEVAGLTDADIDRELLALWDL